MPENMLVSCLIVGLGGFIGANLRYLIGLWFAGRFGAAFPYGTFFINVTGCLILGFFVTLVSERIDVHPTVRLLIAVGFVGAYTTFSTYSVEVVSLLREGRILEAALYAFGSLLLGLIGVYTGTAGARLIL